MPTKILYIPPDQWTSIYIPYIDSSYTREYLTHIFENKYCIGPVKQIDFVRNPSKHNKRKDDSAAFIHFYHWYHNDFTIFLRQYLDKHSKYHISSYFRYFRHNTPPHQYDHFVIMINRSSKTATTPLSSSISSEDEDILKHHINNAFNYPQNHLTSKDIHITLDIHNKRIELLENEIDAIKQLLFPLSNVKQSFSDRHT